ncbi:hypothetical protein AB0N09_35830 [Streptomyces erythrochromogenes]|uniref:hypothetical protein n=1 Tax=Streptomyces erythrochromogenes TaxID=285574 RepID=UPI0034137107
MGFRPGAAARLLTRLGTAEEFRVRIRAHHLYSSWKTAFASAEEDERLARKAQRLNDEHRAALERLDQLAKAFNGIVAAPDDPLVLLNSSTGKVTLSAPWLAKSGRLGIDLIDLRATHHVSAEELSRAVELAQALGAPAL